MYKQGQNELQNALGLFQKGRQGEAIAICEKLLKNNPKDFNVMQLLGAFKNAAGDKKTAQQLFQESLKINSAQPHVHNNLGNILNDLGENDKALKSYKKAVELQPSYADAWYNWAVLLEKTDQLDEAFVKVKQAISHDGRQAKFYNLLGLCYQKEENFIEAIKAFEQAVSCDKNNIKAIHNLGTAYRDVDRSKEAVNCFNYVLNQRQDMPETWEAVGSLHHNSGAFDKSIFAYHKLLELDPDNLYMHRVLSNMMWETGRKQGFLESYVKAMEVNPDSLTLIAAYAEELSLSGSDDVAKETIEAALKKKGDHPSLMQSLAQIKVRTGDLVGAGDLMEKVLRVEKNNNKYYTDFAEILLKQGNYEHALKQAELAGELNPNYQKTWAIKGDCWRNLGDERYHWLYDFEHLVQVQELAAPEGYGNIAEFNEELEEVLTALHINDVHPRDQTLTGGTQTIGNLFKNRNNIIQKLHHSALDAVKRYIKELPDDDTHPHLRRKTEMLHYVGSWSVLLSSKGFHVNHYHSEGWISGPYYVRVPDVIKDSSEDGERAGWVNFGASPYGSKECLIPQKIIKPVAGCQVFFPSYMWHGTNPFVSDECRMTVAGDIVPV